MDMGLGDHPAYVWNGAGLRCVAEISAPPLALLKGIDDQKARVAENIARHAGGVAAHDMLLWGARGMGKSALIRSAVLDARGTGADIALVQISASDLTNLPELFSRLRGEARRFILFIDDLGFAAGDMDGPRRLRSMLEGGVEARPDNIRLAVTSNHRAVLSREVSHSEELRHGRDNSDDELALADRFGLIAGFHACSQDDYLAIISGFAAHYGLTYEQGDALTWSKQRGARSGRVAWQFIVELAGREGRSLS